MAISSQIKGSTLLNNRTLSVTFILLKFWYLLSMSLYNVFRIWLYNLHQNKRCISFSIFCVSQWSHVLKSSGIFGQLCLPVSIFKLWFPNRNFAVALRWSSFVINSKNEEHLVSCLKVELKTSFLFEFIRWIWCATSSSCNFEISELKELHPVSLLISVSSKFKLVQGMKSSISQCQFSDITALY
jgi:hypothetical protein